MSPDTRPDPLAEDVQRLKAYIRTECASNNLRWRVDDPKAQYDPLVRLSAIYGRIDDWAAGVTLTQPQPARRTITFCPSGCGHTWWTVGDDSYGCSGEAQPQPDTGLREAALRLVRSVDALAAWDEAHGYIVNSERDALAYDEDAAWEEVRAALRSTPAAPKEDDRG